MLIVKDFVFRLSAEGVFDDFQQMTRKRLEHRDGEFAPGNELLGAKPFGKFFQQTVDQFTSLLWRLNDRVLMNSPPRALIVRLDHQGIPEVLRQLRVSRREERPLRHLNPLHGQDLIGQTLVQINQQQGGSTAGKRQAEVTIYGRVESLAGDALGPFGNIEDQVRTRCEQISDHLVRRATDFNRGNFVRKRSQQLQQRLYV